MFMGAKSHRTAGASSKEIEKRRLQRVRQFQQQNNSPAISAPVERVQQQAGFIETLKGFFK